MHHKKAVSLQDFKRKVSVIGFMSPMQGTEENVIVRVYLLRKHRGVATTRATEAGASVKMTWLGVVAYESTVFYSF